MTIVTILNVVGLDVGKWLHNAGAVAMWLPVVIIIGMGAIAWHRFGSATSFNATSLIPSTRFKGMIFWSSLTFAFGGCETASFMGEEIKNTRRTLPWALFTAGLVVTFCYVAGTVGVLLALPRDQVSNLQGLMQAIARTAGRIGFFWIIPVTAGFIALSNLGAASAFLAAVARLPFVAGIDRFLPPVFGKLHPRWRTPYVALVLQAVCGAVFVFLGQAGTSVKGAYDVLVSMGIITYFLPYLFLFGYVPLAERTGRTRGDSRPRWQTHSIVALLRGIQYRISHHRSFVRSKPRGSPPSARYCKSCGRNWSIGCSGCVPILAGTKKGAAGQRLISSMRLVFTSSRRSSSYVELV